MVVKIFDSSINDALFDLFELIQVKAIFSIKHYKLLKCQRSQRTDNFPAGQAFDQLMRSDERSDNNN